MRRMPYGAAGWRYELAKSFGVNEKSPQPDRAVNFFDACHILANYGTVMGTKNAVAASDL